MEELYSKASGYHPEPLSRSHRKQAPTTELVLEERGAVVGWEEGDATLDRKVLNRGSGEAKGKEAERHTGSRSRRAVTC